MIQPPPTIGKRFGALAIAVLMALAPLGGVAPEAQAQSGYDVQAANYTSVGVPQLSAGLINSTTQIDLTLGKAKVINLDVPANRVAISNPNVVGIVVITPTQVQLVGKAVGVANLLVWSETTGESTLSIDISVNRDVATLAKQLKFIDPDLTVQPMAAEDTIILTGMVDSPEEAQIAYDLAAAFMATPVTTPSGTAAAAAPPATAVNPQSIRSTSSGSATFGPSSNKIINLIKIKGQESTRSGLIQAKLKEIDPNISLRIFPGFNGAERAVLTGRVKDTTVVAKAVNFTAMFYGEPGLKIIAGQGGNILQEGQQQQEAQTDTGNFAPDEVEAGLVGNFGSNLLYGSIVTDQTGNVVSLLEVEKGPVVRTKIMFLEVRKNRQFTSNNYAQILGRELNLVTPGGALAVATPTPAIIQALPNGVNAAQAAFGGQEFGALLSAVVNSGDARILAEPTITTLSGEPASFLAGGEFPIPVLGTNGQIIVTFKQFGIRLQMLPTITDRGTVHMQITPEVSNIDPTAGITLQGITVPGLATRRSQAVVELKDGDYFVLGGLYDDRQTDTYNKFPILGQIPILGSLFRSQDFQRQKTELVVVIHPEIKHDMDLSELEATAHQPADDIQVRAYTDEQVRDWVNAANETKTQSTVFGLRHPKRERELEYTTTQLNSGMKPKAFPRNLSPSMTPDPGRQTRLIIDEE
ncbi:MAG: pilus assembly protein N-terminal domain-containing protein [Cyanobacteria bacterium HKST-UBA05]|nr:pilus assembly protein N-terminal domain-containing protein [Cyanobacteria bacterium HKST-UBA05]